MPSSLIFVGLVVIWLLILVPAIARHQQEVARPSVSALSGRVLERPRRRRRSQEVDVVDEWDDHGAVATRDERGDERHIPAARREAEPDHGWERPPPRYRRGRGGFDPEAAALAARARYAFRQRVVLALLIAVVVTAAVALFAFPVVWWAHGAVDLVLVAYLVYLRRQVRMEEAIRARRAARMAGTRRPSAAEDPELDEWARRGREVTRRPASADGPGEAVASAEYEEVGDLDGEYGDDIEPTDDDRDAPAASEPVASGSDAERAEAAESAEATGSAGSSGRPDGPEEPALPRLDPAPPPPLPAGTALVESDDEDPELHDLDEPAPPEYRRAAGE